ncbi:hypothetical protein OSI81_25575, partial [Mycobacterium ulcerans]
SVVPVGALGGSAVPVELITSCSAPAGPVVSAARVGIALVGTAVWVVTGRFGGWWCGRFAGHGRSRGGRWWRWRRG